MFHYLFWLFFKNKISFFVPSSKEFLQFFSQFLFFFKFVTFFDCISVHLHHLSLRFLFWSVSFSPSQNIDAFCWNLRETVLLSFLFCASRQFSFICQNDGFQLSLWHALNLTSCRLPWWPSVSEKMSLNWNLMWFITFSLTYHSERSPQRWWNAQRNRWQTEKRKKNVDGMHRRIIKDSNDSFQGGIRIMDERQEFSFQTKTS